MNIRRKTVAATVTIIYLLAVLVVPSFAYVSYNAAASIFWKSGMQGVYFSTQAGFNLGDNSIYEIPSSSMTSSNDRFFDTEFLSNYRNKYVDDGSFHFAYEYMDFYQTGEVNLVYPVTDLYTYLVFNRILYVDPGETVQFYFVPLSNRWRFEDGTNQNIYWYYFNLLSSVNFGMYDPTAPAARFVEDQVLTYNVSVVATTTYQDTYPRNVYQITAKNNSSTSVTVSGLRFTFSPSVNQTNLPTEYPSFTPLTGQILSLGLRDYMSNVIKWFDSPETDAVMNELAQIRAKQNRQIEIDEGIASSVSDVSSDVEDIKDYFAETADYSDVTAPPEYDPNIPESQAVARWDNYLNDAEDVLGQQDFRSSATFWQRTVTYLISLPGALTMSGLFAALLGLRAVIGR